MRTLFAVVLLVAAASAPAQSITEFPIPSDEADSWDLCLGPDGAIWFNEPIPNKLGRVDMQGNITEFPTVGGAYGCAAGPDGNIWFVGGPHIGRMTTSGLVTMLPDLEDPAEATSVVAGSDGNLWVGLIEGRIARVTMAGVVTYFTLGYSTPLPGIGGPYSLALGPDGNVWYALPTLDVVGKITPDGAVTNYPTLGLSPFAIGPGSDGELWFVGNGAVSGGVAARMTTQGNLQAFGATSNSAYGIGAGPDGEVWFAEGGTEKIGRVTPAGVITEIDLPGPPARFTAGAYDVISGSDGNLWYVRRGENRIGRVTLAGQRQPVERPRTHERTPIVVPRPQ
jgi:virginiamycin B lyase